MWACSSAGISSVCLQEEWTSLLASIMWLALVWRRGGKGSEAALIAKLPDERGVSPASKKGLGGRHAYR